MIAAIVATAVVAQVSTGSRSAFRSGNPVHIVGQTSFQNAMRV
jgi:hypothetical protein